MVYNLARKSTIELANKEEKEELSKIISSNEPWLFFEPFNLAIVTALEKILSDEDIVSKVKVIWSKH